MRSLVRHLLNWAVPPMLLTFAVLTPLAWAEPPPPEKPPGERVPAPPRTWPVGTRPAVLRGWEPPATVYAAGHRGVDLAAAPGAPVRAVAAGRVSYAGRVAGRGVVAVALAGTSLRTTYGRRLPGGQGSRRLVRALARRRVALVLGVRGRSRQRRWGSPLLAELGGACQAPRARRHFPDTA
ncbi:peptidoglycan DD-metalloendopeptidase family protein [Streptomyces seoulensis]|uniref:peptidoglycan DD-metalloendopeptidase family protein n=1 Tax=Streptomyces seoulensis TaxID=73044 RepID=UPI000A5DDFC8|nr:M23 family metallopeptidase [Streptomyces seoulensis]